MLSLFSLLLFRIMLIFRKYFIFAILPGFGGYPHRRMLSFVISPYVLNIIFNYIIMVSQLFFIANLFMQIDNQMSMFIEWKVLIVLVLLYDNIKMRDNLIKANEIIHSIESNFSNPKKLRNDCTELQDLLEYISPATNYHYHLFLAEIYATKLADFKQSEKICKKYMKDQRQSVQFEATLRYSFINAIMHEYQKALSILVQVNQRATENKTELKLIVKNYCERLLNYSKYCNLLRGIKCQNQQNYEEAMKFYHVQFELQANSGQIQNKYFASKAFLSTSSIFPTKVPRGVDQKKFNAYLQELQEEEEQRNAQDFIKELDSNYKKEKKYLCEVIQILKNIEGDLKKTKKSQKYPVIKFNSQMQIKKLVAIYKLKKVLQRQYNLDGQIREEFQNCLVEIKENRIINYTMINQFTVKECKIFNRANEIYRRMYLKHPMQVFDQIIEQIYKNKQRPRKSLYSSTQSPIKKKNQPPKAEYIKPMIKPTYSESASQFNTIAGTENFAGSYMQKINQTSSGYQKRYFYFVRSQLDKGKLKLYYNLKQKNKSKDDQYYEFKNVTKIEEGKRTKAFQRDECSKFQESKCFSILYDGKRSKNFYVPSKKDYQCWISLLRKLMPSYQETKKLSNTVTSVNNAQMLKSRKNMGKTVIFNS